MAEETLAEIDAQKTQSAEEGIADFLFGKEEAPEEGASDVEEYEAGQEPVQEGEDSEENEEVEASEEEEEASEFVEIEFDGKLYEVPPELKDALLRQSDYTTKTQEVANQRKEVEVIQGQLKQAHERFQFAEKIQEDVLKVQQLDQTANQYHQYMKENIENLSSTDIEKLRFAIEDARRERDDLARSIQGKQQEFQQAQEQSIKELLKQGTEVLKSKIPQWGEEHQRQVRDYGLSLGFAESELDQVIDPRQVEVLWKASQYDTLQKGKTAAVKKVKDSPQIKPKARDPKTGRFQKEQKLKQALKSDQLSAYDKATLIGDDIAGRFFS